MGQRADLLQHLGRDLAVQLDQLVVGGLSAGAAVPLMGATADPSWLGATASAAAPGDQILVVVQARGGYDFVNMFPEVDDATYKAARVDLRLAKNKVLTLKTGRLQPIQP